MKSILNEEIFFFRHSKSSFNKTKYWIDEENKGEFDLSVLNWLSKKYSKIFKNKNFDCKFIILLYEEKEKNETYWIPFVYFCQ
jgi:hypothetical protein